MSAPSRWSGVVLLVVLGCSSGVSPGSTAATAQPVTGVSPHWDPAGTLSVRRDEHTATLLPSGKVLVASNGSSELYDPCTGSWGAVTNMVAARFLHTATLLSSGRVLVVGGYVVIAGSAVMAASAEIYDPTTNAWTAAASMSAPRAYHAAALLGSGKVLVSGGGERSLEVASAELYDEATDTWSAAAPMPEVRAEHTASLLPSGKLLVVGGRGFPTSPFVSAGWDTALLFDPDGGTWSAAGVLTDRHVGHTAVVLPSGKVLVAGGTRAVYQGMRIGIASTELYDPDTLTWSSSGAMSDPRIWHTSSLLPSGDVLTAGGIPRSDWMPGPSSAVEVFGAGAGAWSAAPSMAHGRIRHTATSLPSGKVLVVGGYSQDSAELYDPGTPETYSATMRGFAPGSRSLTVSVSAACTTTFSETSATVFHGSIQGASAPTPACRQLFSTWDRLVEANATIQRLLGLQAAMAAAACPATVTVVDGVVTELAPGWGAP